MEKNISSRHSNEDATSMYLSFDAESTMSTACYKTLEAISNFSGLSGIDMNVSVNEEKPECINSNSTLELHTNPQHLSPLKTVKKSEVMNEKLNTPFKALPKNIKEYKALCSTPSTEQLLKTVDVMRGSDIERCVDLGTAFLDVDDEKPAYFSPPNVGFCEENKENVLPDAEEVSTLSTCSSLAITSVIEKKKLTSISNVVSTREDAIEGLTVGKDMPIHFIEEISKACYVSDTDVEPSTQFCQNLDNNAKSRSKDNNIAIIKDFPGIQKEETPLIKDFRAEKKNTDSNSFKPKIAVLTGNKRDSVCAPNLQTNKPSRIINSYTKRRSLLPTCKKSAVNINAEIEIPLLMQKILKITNTPMETEKDNLLKDEEISKMRNSTTAEKRRSIIASMKTCPSLIPPATGYKKPYTFPHRMSLVVKTTLNSPARKIARKSSLSGVTLSMQRRSVVPQKINSTDINIKKTGTVSRKSIVQKSFGTNITTQSDVRTIGSLQEKFIQPTSTIAQRKHRLGNIPEKEIASKNACLIHNKPVEFYACKDCKENFRIKSLFDAHKRSHETDINPPAVVKRPLTTTKAMSSTVFGNSNQCKYCDKKFALLKALHIHLLQNCSKIPPSEKRNLQYTELNHVEKAQLPNVFQHPSLHSSASSSVSSLCDTVRYTLSENRAKFSLESLNKNKDVLKQTSIATTASQTAAQKTKKITAHTGVYRTPSKSVPCHLCKLTFKNILDYTNHNLTYHGKYKGSVENDTLKKGYLK